MAQIDGSQLDGGFATRSVHGGRIDDAYGSVVTPLYQTSIFEFPDADLQTFAGAPSR
jgi:O-acetylhomoserine/O-acetylserine sulfhydrylase-like pyridoxal-dependent enzyme